MGRWDDEDEQLWYFDKGLTFDGWEKYKIKKSKSSVALSDGHLEI